MTFSSREKRREPNIRKKKEEKRWEYFLPVIVYLDKLLSIIFAFTKSTPFSFN